MNLPINSRLLCQLSYRGLPVGANLATDRGMTLAYEGFNAGIGR